MLAQKALGCLRPEISTRIQSLAVSARPFVDQYECLVHVLASEKFKLLSKLLVPRKIELNTKLSSDYEGEWVTLRQLDIRYFR